MYTAGDTIRAKLLQSKLGLPFWAHAGIHYAANHNFTHKNPDGTTPYEALGHQTPKHVYLKPFGCACTFVPPKGEGHKYDPRGRDAVYLCPFLQDGLLFTGDYLVVPKSYFLNKNEKLRII